MKPIVAIIPLAFFLFSCASTGYDKITDPTENETISVPIVEERLISNEIRKKLGISETDLLIAMQEGKTVVFVSEKFKTNRTERPPLGKKFVNLVTIVETRNSPTCYFFSDFGYAFYYPSPDCPHD